MTPFNNSTNLIKDLILETFNKVLELNYNNEFQFVQLIKYISLKNTNKTNKVYYC